MMDIFHYRARASRSENTDSKHSETPTRALNAALDGVLSGDYEYLHNNYGCRNENGINFHMISATRFGEWNRNIELLLCAWDLGFPEHVFGAKWKYGQSRTRFSHFFSSLFWRAYDGSFFVFFFDSDVYLHNINFFMCLARYLTEMLHSLASRVCTAQIFCCRRRRWDHIFLKGNIFLSVILPACTFFTMFASRFGFAHAAFCVCDKAFVLLCSRTRRREEKIFRSIIIGDGRSVCGWVVFVSLRGGNVSIVLVKNRHLLFSLDHSENLIFNFPPQNTLCFRDI